MDTEDRNSRHRSICDGCGKPVYRSRFVGGKWMGIDCNCVREIGVVTTNNPYGDLTLQHVHGEDGKPLRVTSSRQLGAAEQKFNFSSVVRNMNESNFDAPPPARRQGIGETYHRKFSKRG